MKLTILLARAMRAKIISEFRAVLEYQQMKTK